MKVGQTLVVQDARRGRLLLVRFDEAKLRRYPLIPGRLLPPKGGKDRKGG